MGYRYLSCWWEKEDWRTEEENPEKERIPGVWGSL